MDLPEARDVLDLDQILSPRTCVLLNLSPRTCVLLILSPWALCACLMHINKSAQKQDFIRRHLRRCLERWLKTLLMKTHHFTHEVLMGLQKYMVIGLQRIIENLMICLLVVDFYLITNLKEGASNL